MLQDSSISPPARFIGLDIHKEYFVAVGVNSQKEPVFGPQTVPVYRLDEWIRSHLTPADAIVLEMTVNCYLFLDCLLPYVHSVTLVHPPHVGLFIRVQVKTDRKAAQTLAELHAVGMLDGVRENRACMRAIRSEINYVLGNRKANVSFTNLGDLQGGLRGAGNSIWLEIRVKSDG